MILYHARWVLPITSAPVRDGTVAVESARIVYVGPRADAPPGEERDLGRAVLLPGLINAHTHLELTAFHEVIPSRGFRDWIVTLQALKTAVMNRESYLDSARQGIADGLRAGITTYADTCDSGVALEAMREMGVRGIMYQEVFGPDPAQAEHSMHALEKKLDALEPTVDDLRHLGVSPHAPFTVSDALFKRVAELKKPMAIHVAESREETALIKEGSGPFADGLRARKIAVAPRANSPVDLLDKLGVLRTRPLLVHCVQVDARDARTIAKASCAVAHCPRSNELLGHGVAPLATFLDAGVHVGLGSDSMASNERMDILNEARLAASAQVARGANVDVTRTLTLATAEGARAIGFSHRVGALEPGKDADLTAFDIDAPDEMIDGGPEVALAAHAPPHARATIVAGVVRVWEHKLLGADIGLSTRVRAINTALRADPELQRRSGGHSVRS